MTDTRIRQLKWRAWTVRTSTTTSYNDRITHLTGPIGGLNGTNFLNSSTIDDDAVKDILNGAGGSVWFLFSNLDKVNIITGEHSVTI